jgi:hypothetical protein
VGLPFPFELHPIIHTSFHNSKRIVVDNPVDNLLHSYLGIQPHLASLDIGWLPSGPVREVGWTLRQEAFWFLSATAWPTLPRTIVAMTLARPSGISSNLPLTKQVIVQTPMMFPMTRVPIHRVQDTFGLLECMSAMNCQIAEMMAFISHPTCLHST